jgi:hypothetical protein
MRRALGVGTNNAREARDICPDPLVTLSHVGAGFSRPHLSAMTYNFDPDRWYENQRRVLDLKHERGELDAARYQAELDDLECRYEAMQARLDKPFGLGDETAGPK